MKTWIRLAAVCLSVLFLCSCQPASPADSPKPDPNPTVLTEPKFLAAVVERSGNTLVVAPLQGEDEYNGGNTRISLSMEELASDILLGSAVEIAYDGQIMESYPAQIHASAIQKIDTPLDVPFEAEWLDKETAESYDDQQRESDLYITAIYADCFFARSVVPMPYIYKFNGALGEEWCIGDKVHVTYQHDYYLADRAEAELISIEASTFTPDPNACYKPVIYLYPEENTAVDVTLTLNGELTCTYPAYTDGWHVTAAPDGTLTDDSGQTYNYLYWEGDVSTAFDRSHGFCVKGEDTAAFLEETLEQLGLTRREANEFIVYWLPVMQENPYNVITFQTEAYTEAAQLAVSPAPDTLIRVFMTFSASDRFVELPAQTLTAPARNGFVVVEWGGTKMK